MRNLRLDVCYDGTRYKGWQRLAGADQTIQGKLEQTLTRLLGEPIEVSGSGRTDAGTHARGQVVSFQCNSTMSCEEILDGLRQYLPEDIGVISCKNASPRFHARLNAKTKTYCYRVWVGENPAYSKENTCILTAGHWMYRKSDRRLKITLVRMIFLRSAVIKI